MSTAQKMVVFVWVFLLSVCCWAGSSLAAYKCVRMSDVCNTTRQAACDRGGTLNHWAMGGVGFDEWFNRRDIVLKEIPFKLSSGVSDALSGTSLDKQSFEIPCPPGNVIYLLGTGYQLSRELGYNGDYCEDIRRFNIEAVYSDGSTEEISPVNIVSLKPVWYDLSDSEVSVAAFRMKSIDPILDEPSVIGNLSIYAVLPSKPSLLTKLYFNDNDTPGDYTVFAVTVSDVVPTELARFVKDGPRRMHDRPATVKAGPCNVSNDDSFVLCDIHNFCNQSISKCFDSGFGVGRGITSGLSTIFTADKVIYDGIPFRVSSGARNVVSGSKKGLESYTISLNQRATKVYALLGLMTDVATVNVPKDCVDDPLYFNFQIIYKDGTSDTCFPRAVANGEYKVLSSSKNAELRAYVLEPLQNKEIEKIRVNDRMDEGDFVLAGLTLSNEPSDFSMPPVVVTNWRKEPTFKPAAVVETGSVVLLENRYASFVLSTNDGLSLVSLINKYLNQEMIHKKGCNNLFEVYDVGNKSKRYANTDFKVTDVTLKNHPEQASASFELEPNDGSKFKVLVDFGIDDSPECRFSCNILNTSSDSDKEFKIHQFLTNIVIGDAANTYYFYPPPRGTIDNNPLKIRKCYGGSNYLQFMDVFNPTLGAGIYVRPDDAWGQGKILSFWKYGDKTNTVIDDDWANYPGEFMPALEVDIDNGCYMGLEYWDRVAKPGAKTETPPLVIGMHTGDWHAAFDSYKNWVGTAFIHRQAPDWLRKSFSMTGYNSTNVHDQDNRYCLWSERGLDIVEPAIWWNEPGEPSYTGGTEEYHYREDWGGKEAFKAAVAAAARRGVRVVPYIEGLTFPAQFFPGNNAEWLQSTSCIVTKDGKPKARQKCPGAPEWQDYLASVAARLVKDLGVKGIYLDSVGQVPAMGCYDPRHNHRYPGQTWVHDVAELYRKVGTAIRAVDPEAVLYSEAPCADVATCELDGSWLSYWDFEPESPRRFGNPLLGALQSFVYRDKKFWCLTDILPTGQREGFFPALTLTLNAGFASSPTALSPYQRSMSSPADPHLANILKDNYKIYTSENAEPFIQSYIHWVFVNKFGSGRDVIYNVLNNNFFTVRGKMFEVAIPGVYKDLVSGNPANILKEGSRYFVSFELGPKGVAALKRIE